MRMIFPIHVIGFDYRKATRIQVLRGGLPFAVFALTLMLHCSIFGGVSGALAQSETKPGANPFTNQGEIANPRAPRKGDGVTIRLTKRQCRHLVVSHKASGDVAYKPGLDVRGNPVVPADLSGGFEWITPDEIEFDLAFNPLGNTGLDADDFSNTNANVGTIKYDILSGRLTLNGRPLSDPLLAVIENQCRAAGFLD